jgi:hypothetical protein
MSLEIEFGEEAVERSGFTLVHFRPAAAPVYQLTVRVLTLDRKPLNPIEEGCLRAVEAGLQSSADIRAFLGLQEMVLNSVLASLYSQELINYQGSTTGNAVVALTTKGKQALLDSRLVVPQERIVKLVFDPILKKVVFHQNGTMWRPKEVRAAGRFEVPLCGVRRPEVEDIPLEDIDRSLERVRRTNDESSELLAIRRIERREMLFTPCTILYFRSNTGKEVQVAFHFEQGLSLAYENAFRELGGPDEVGAIHVSAENAEPIPPFPVVSENPASPEPASARGATPGAPTLEVIRCHHHPPLLKEALKSSNERLLIISPWINSFIVDKSFLKSLETLLRNGVQVYIGYGIDEGKKNAKPIIDKASKEGLEDLDRRFKNFHFALIGNTHRKTLVSDRKFAVQTSFNWLSFKGDPSFQPRDESGLLVSKVEYIDQMFQDNVDLINKGYDHPKP